MSSAARKKEAKAAAFREAVKNSVDACFEVGSTVRCTTCFGDDIEGEVINYEHSVNMLLMKCLMDKDSLSPVNKLSGLVMVNISFCSHVEVTKELDANSKEGVMMGGNDGGNGKKLTLEELKVRSKNAVLKRKDFLKSKNPNATPLGEELFRALAKQFNDFVAWQETRIVVLNEVNIFPPYQVENVGTKSKNKTARNYIKRLVETFHKNRAGQQQQQEKKKEESKSESEKTTQKTVQSIEKEKPELTTNAEEKTLKKTVETKGQKGQMGKGEKNNRKHHANTRRKYKKK